MRLKILVTADYGRLNAVQFKAGEEVDAEDFGDLDYIDDCVSSGHIEVIDDSDPVEALTPSEPAPVMNSMGQVVSSKGVDITDEALLLAELNGVDLSKVKGSGKNERILVSDIEAAVESDEDD